MGMTAFLFILSTLLITSARGHLYMDKLSDPDEFVGEIAHKNLKVLTDIGPRVAGSRQNEIQAIEFLNRTIKKIIDNALPIHRIEMDVQKANGTRGDYLYFGAQNVAVKFTSADNSEPDHFILLNSHFDTGPTSPGAGDDGSMVVIMIEILRKLSQNNETFQHGIIFLFNGLEEYNLLGAHAFVKQHKWFYNVRAFMNMDATSAGGKEILFQTGPKYPFLVELYAKHVPHPYTTCIAEDLFQSGLVPSATDFQTFSQMGRIPGLDFAYAYRGYMYHTKHDSIDKVPVESLQRTGDNLLALTKALANAYELTDIRHYRQGKVIFFDVFNIFTIYYSENEALIIHIGTIGISVILLIASLFVLANKGEVDVKTTVIEFLICFVIQLVATVLGYSVSMMFANIFDALGRSMSWYTSTWLVFGLYFCPYILILLVFPLFYRKLRGFGFKDQKFSVIVFLQAQYLLCLLIFLFLIIMKLRASYLLMIATTFYAFSNMINILTGFKKICWVIVHMLWQIIPFVYFCSLTNTVFGTVIPMAGHGNPDKNPELLIAIAGVLASFLLFGFLTPLIGLLRRPSHIVGLVGVFWIISLICMASPMGFPYKEETSPQIHNVYHTLHRTYNLNGTLEKEQSKIVLEKMDRNYLKYIWFYIPELENATTLDEDCDVYCEILSFYQMHSESNYWIPAAPPKFSVETLFEKQEIMNISETQTKYNFVIKGVDRMQIYMIPIHGNHVQNWHFNGWNLIDGHESVTLVYGAEEPVYNFTVDVFHSEKKDDSLPTFRLVLVGNYIHHNNERTPEFNKFIDSFPNFTHVAAFQNYYEERYY